MPNGMYGGVRGQRKSALLDFYIFTELVPIFCQLFVIALY